MSISVSELSALALAVWQHGLRDRGAHLYVVVRRVERALGTVCDPSMVSMACRELVRAGYADRSPLGYRARRVAQLGLEVVG